MDFRFSEEQQAVLEAVREFVAREVAPHVEDIQANAKGFEKLYQYTVNGR